MRVMKRSTAAGALAIGLAMWLGLGGLAHAQQAGPQPGRTYRVGFSQIVDHPALNATRQGFQDGLKSAGFIEGKNLIFEYLNAQGDVANARNIAEKFVADKVDLMAPCTTPNVQAAIRVTRGTTVPVAFGCVTNPVESGILASLDKPTGTNVTGFYGLPPVAKMFDLMLQIRPDAKKIGTIYNAAESNSVTLNNLCKAEAERRGLTWVEAQVASSAEVKTAVDSLVGRADTFLMPQDNTVASAFDAVVKTMRDNKIPLFSFDSTSVERGAIAAYAVNQYQSGVDWATEVAVPVLLGRDPGTLVPVSFRGYDLNLNTAAARAASITLSPDVLKQATKVYDK
jgi:putative ABC transport system substrate-binding protein